MSWIGISPWRQNFAGQNLTIGATNAASSAVSSYTQAVQLSATGNCHVAFGRAAVATDMLIKATDPPIVLAIGPGETVNVIQDGTSTGTLNVVEVSH